MISLIGVGKLILNEGATISWGLGSQTTYEGESRLSTIILFLLLGCGCKVTDQLPCVPVTIPLLS